MRAEWRYAPEARSWVLAVWTADGAPGDLLGSAAAASLTAIPPKVREHVAEAMWHEHGIRPPAAVFDGPPGEEVTFTCPGCWAVSFDPGRARSRVCGSCPGVVAVPVPAQRAGEPASEAPAS